MDRQKIFDSALKVFLFLSPIFTFKNFQVSFARGLFFVIGSFVLFGISLGLREKRVFSNIWLSCFFLLALIRVFLDGNIGSGEWFNFWYGFAGFLYIFSGILLFRTVYCHCVGFKRYLKPILFVCILNLVLTLAQVFNYDFMWTNKHELGNLCGFLETSAQLGQYSAMSLPILFYINPFLAIIPFFTLIFSKSITPIAASFLVILFSGIKLRNNSLAVTIALIFLTLAVFNIPYIKVKWYTRPIMWKKTLSTALRKPFLGWGYQSFKDKVIDSEDMIGHKDNPKAFNDYLHTAQELGFPILGAIGLFFFGLFKKFSMIRNKDKLLLCMVISIAIVLVNMAGQTLIRYASISGTFIVLLALFCIKVDNEYLINE